MPFVNKNTESVLIVAFYKKTLSTICSGSLSTVSISNIMSLSGHVSQFCVWKILCVVNVVKGGWVGGVMYFFFFSLKTKNLSLVISWLH